MASARHRLTSLAQAAVFLLIWWLSDQIVTWLHLPAPASVVGLLLLTVLFMSGWVAPTRLEAGARLLLGEMLLFFVPPMMALVKHQDLLSGMGLKLVLLVLCGTLLVMATVGLAVERVIRLEDRLNRRGSEPHAHPERGAP